MYKYIYICIIGTEPNKLLYFINAVELKTQQSAAVQGQEQVSVNWCGRCQAVRQTTQRCLCMESDERFGR